MRLELLLAGLQLLHVAGWSAYFALTRMVYSGSSEYLVMLAAAETIPTIAGVLGAILAERLGYRPIFLLGIAEGLFLSLTGIWLHRPELLWLAALIASFSWSLAGPQILGYALTVSGLSARSLGIVLAGGTIGWSLGGAAAPILAAYVGADVVLVVSGIIVAAIYLVLGLMPQARPSRKGGKGLTRLRYFAVAIIPASLAFVGTEIVGTIYMAKLSVEMERLGYALGIALSGFIGAAVRPYAGSLVDRIGEARVLPLVLILYAGYIPLLASTHGPIFMAVWLLPLYPLFDVAIYKYAARLVGEAMGSAAVSSAYSIAGIVLLSAARLRGETSTYNALAVAAFLAAATAAAIGSRVVPERSHGEHLIRGPVERGAGG
ncbi:MFS transporter [Hyperthermus butylicus]